MPGSVELFRKYPNPIFIETGTWVGDGVRRALAAGFEHVYSVDIEPGETGHAIERFGKNPRVTLSCEDSPGFLNRVLKTIDRPATVWLDAHCVPKGCPLLRELREIKNNPWFVDTILIDDMRMLRGGSEWARELPKGMEEHAIYQELLSMGGGDDAPRWWIGYEDDSMAQRDILVATRRRPVWFSK